MQGLQQSVDSRVWVECALQVLKNDTDSAAFRFEGTYHVDLGIHCQKATTATPTMPNAVTFVV